jgi:hypothetical protein
MQSLTELATSIIAAVEGGEDQVTVMQELMTEIKERDQQIEVLKTLLISCRADLRIMVYGNVAGKNVIAVNVDDLVSRIDQAVMEKE